MTQNHNLTLDYLDQATVADLVGLEVSALASLDDQVAQLKDQIKAYDAKLHAAYERQFMPKVKELLAEAERDTGTVHVASDGWDVVVNIHKKVEYDQDRLKAALDSLSPDDARHYAKVTVTVDERKFVAAPPAVQTLLGEARTVKAGKPTYSFKQLEQEAVA